MNISSNFYQLNRYTIGRVDSFLFLCKIVKTLFFMDRAVLKGLVRTLKALILELEAEVFADKELYTKPRENYDDPVEYYNSNDDDDGYAD